MKKRTNLVIGSILIGLAVYLFFEYDEWAYNRDHKQSAGGAE